MTADPASYPMAAFLGEEIMNSMKLQQILNINITPVFFKKKKNAERGGLASTNRDVWSTHLDPHSLKPEHQYKSVDRPEKSRDSPEL